jgi:hypothetical protein
MVKKSPAVLVFVLEHHTHTPMRRWTTHVQLFFFELLMKMMKAWLCIYANFSETGVVVGSCWWWCELIVCV